MSFTLIKIGRLTSHTAVRFLLFPQPLDRRNSGSATAARCVGVVHSGIVAYLPFTRRNSTAKRIGTLRHDHPMHVIGHQTPTQNADSGIFAQVPHEIQ